MGRAKIVTVGNIIADTNTHEYLRCNNKTIILPVVLYGCETWSLTLREGGTYTEGV
jgi:hypothetical protein